MKDARPLFPHLDLDEDPGGLLLPGKDGLDSLHLAGGIHPKGDLHPPAAEVPDAEELLFPHHLVGDENIGEAVFGHDLGLAHLGHGDALGPQLRLHLCDGGALVGLGVGPQGDPLPVGVVLHEPQVVQHDLPVDEKGGCIQGRVFHSASPFAFLMRRVLLHCSTAGAGIQEKGRTNQPRAEGFAATASISTRHPP